MIRIQAEMMANVWKVLVEPGQETTEGQTVVVLESMKMEIAVESPAAGTVVSVEVDEGSSVRTGDVLVVLDDGA